MSQPAEMTSSFRSRRRGTAKNWSCQPTGWLMMPNHPSHAAPAFVTTIEALGNQKLSKLPRCLECEVVTGSGDRFRNAPARVIPAAEADDLGRNFATGDHAQRMTGSARHRTKLRRLVSSGWNLRERRAQLRERTSRSCRRRSATAVARGERHRRAAASVAVEPPHESLSGLSLAPSSGGPLIAVSARAGTRLPPDLVNVLAAGTGDAGYGRHAGRPDQALSSDDSGCGDASVVFIQG